MQYFFTNGCTLAAKRCSSGSGGAGSAPTTAGSHRVQTTRLQTPAAIKPKVTSAVRFGIGIGLESLRGIVVECVGGARRVSRAPACQYAGVRQINPDRATRSHSISPNEAAAR